MEDCESGFVSMSVKLEGFVKPYRGKSDESWENFWSKFSVLADVSGWTTDTDAMKRLPLFLEGDAFLVYSKMSANDKKDKSKVAAAMVKSFGVSKSVAYQQFTSRRLREDESVDAFVADLRQLLTRSGHTDTGEKDAMVIEQLLSGVPVDLAQQIRLSFAGKEMTVSGCADALRALISAKSPSRSVTAAAKHGSVVCHKCGETGHIRRNCPQQRPPSKPPVKSGKKPIVCFFCDQEGHARVDCQERKAWQASRKVVAAASVPAEGKCLATVTTESPLPHVYVDVSTDGEVWKRARGVVDTCSTRTLLASTFVSEHGLHMVTGGMSSMTAIDGNPLCVLGTVTVKLRRVDGPVLLPCIDVDACVVDNLDVVQSDVLIGNDVVTGSGGLYLDYESGVLSRVVFGVQDSVPATASNVAAASVGADEVKVDHPSFHVRAERDGADVVLMTDDAEVRWDSANQRWMVTWRWKEGSPPQGTIGSGISEYSRSGLTAEQEQQFSDEVDGWIERGWLVPHDESLHGKPACVLPLLAQVQEHKATTPVRPCLDYRKLNECLVSKPGLEVPVCEETLRRWRRLGDADEFCLMDIKKAYLQIHVAPDLLKYQVVRWKGSTYVMTRMAFGLNVAPKVMDVVVRWITQDFPGVDNYVDDVLAPVASAESVATKLQEYGLPTKPAESLTSTRVLGLQLSKDNDGQVSWARRAGIDLDLPKQPTLRDLFSWCGRLTGHVPVCGWLRPYCSYLKRIANTGVSWDKPLTDSNLLKFCSELREKLAGDGDPACGQWNAPADVSDQCIVYADASDIALGAVIQLGNVTVEDRSWLRPHNDKRHINVVELDAVVKALSLATQWDCSNIRVVTDSKTVASWLRDVVGNVCRVRAKGLYGTLVQRRLQIVADMISTCDLVVVVDWVPTDQNPADALTRVPAPWVKHCKELKGDDVVAVAATAKVVGPLTMRQIADGQRRDGTIQTVISCLSTDRPVPADFAKVRSQLAIEDGVLLRSVKLPVDGVVSVPVIPDVLIPDVLKAAHCNSGHAAWDTMYEMIRSCCYFPGIAAACQEYVAECTQCATANPRKGPMVSATRASIPGRPWGEVVIDVLELGADHGSEHCVLMCVDTFTKWVEVVPLKRHSADSVAAAFISLCERWGAPDIIRTDNGTEFRNVIVDSLFRLMGVRVQHGAVHHPQSQGSAERANRTLIGLIRKVLEPSSDWRRDLGMLLFYYRTRPHSATGMSPMMAMVGWQPSHLVVAEDTGADNMSSWAEQMSKRSARIRDVVEEHLSAADFQEVPERCPYDVGNAVLLEVGVRRQKRLPPFESGWMVSHIISKSTVVISKPGRLDKVINVSALKPDPVPAATESIPSAADGTDSDCADDDDNDGYIPIELSDTVTPSMSGRGLRDRSSLQLPSRYRE